MIGMKLKEFIEEAEVEDLPQLMREIRKEFQKTVDEVMNQNAIFKAKVGESGRITIPTAEREVLDIESGDIVRVVVKPIENDEEDTDRGD